MLFGFGKLFEIGLEKSFPKCLIFLCFCLALFSLYAIFANGFEKVKRHLSHY